MAQRPIELDETKLNDRQEAVFDAIAGGPRGLVQGPLRVWLQSPELAEKAQALGAFCRYGTKFPARLSELAILVTGAFWRSGFEWAVHAPIGLQAGLDPEIVEAIRLGRKPNFINSDEAAVYAFAWELHNNRRVTQSTYDEVADRFGIDATVELVGLLGYYTLISMTINTFEVPLPSGEPDPFPEA